MAAGECSGDWPSSDNWAALFAAPISDQRSLRQPITCLYSTRRAPHVYWFIILHKATRFVGSANHRCKTTLDRTAVRLDMVRITPKRTTWHMDLCQLTVYEHFTGLSLWNAGGIAVDHISFRFWIYGVIPDIFAIKVESCQKSRWILDVFWPSQILGAGLPKVIPMLWPLFRGTSYGKCFVGILPLTPKL